MLESEVLKELGTSDVRTIATKAKFISLRIMNETKKPDHDNK